MRDYLRSTSGRLALSTVAAAIFLAGLVALAGRGGALLFIAAGPPILIVGAFLSIGLAISEHRVAAMVMVLVGPLAAGPYLGALFAARGLGGAAGLALAATGVALLTRTLLTPVLGQLRRQESQRAHA